MHEFVKCGAMILGAVFAVPLPAQETPADMAKRFHELQAAGDSLGALALMLPDVVIFESGGVEASREEYRSHHLGLDVQFATAVNREIVDQQSRVVGDFAWVLTQIRVTGMFREREVNSHGVETMLLRRTPEGWRIMHVHWSSRREQG